MTSSPAGINCGNDCIEPYNEGTSVTLTANPAAGSTFAGWSWRVHRPDHVHGDYERLEGGHRDVYR